MAWHFPGVFDYRWSAKRPRHSYFGRGARNHWCGASNNGITVAVQNEIERLSDEDTQVVVVVQSYGGMVGTGAVEGLGYTKRQKAGKSGGVKMLVCMAAFVANSRTSALDMLGGKLLP